MGFDNFMARWMGLTEELDLDRLQRRYQLVCVQEEMEKSLQLLSELLGFHIENEKMRENSDENYRRFRISGEIAALFKERNHLDYSLYELSLCRLRLS